MTATETMLIEKIMLLSKQRIAEVVDFVDLLRARDVEQRHTRIAAKTKEPSFAVVWDGDEDAAYDRL